MKLLAGALVVVFGALAGESSTARCEPLALLRKLQDIAEARASGVEGPSIGRREEIVSLLRSSAQNGDEGWKAPRKFGVIVSLSLVGVEPWLAHQANSVMPPGGVDQPLAQYALAYAKGQAPPDASQFEKIDVRALPPEVAGAVAFAQARLLVEHDRALASERFRAARILAPGGLIEEAALREELFMLDGRAAPQILERIAARYFSRFHQSVNSENFVRRLESLFEEIWSFRDQEARNALMPILEGLPIAARRPIAMRVVRWSLLHGDSAGARRVLGAACASREENEGSDERCDLYRQIGGMFDAPHGGKSALQGQRVQLNDEDRLLLECATLVAAFTGNARDVVRDAADHQDTETMRLVKAKIAEADRFMAEAR